MTSEQPESPRPERPARSDHPPASEFEAALRGHFSEFEVLDRDLELPALSGASARRLVEIVAADGAGHLILALEVDGESEETLLAAVDALCLTRAQFDLLARHLSRSRLDEGELERARLEQREPLVVLVSRSFSTRVIARLALLAAGELQLFEIASIKSANRAGAYLVPIDRHTIPARRSTRTSADFIAELPVSQRAVAELAIKLISRIDCDLACEVASGVVQWSFDRQPLCSLVARAGRLEGGRAFQETRIALRSPSDVEEFVDGVLREHLHMLVGDDSSAPDAGIAADLRGREPILTPEEIAAFRD